MAYIDIASMIGSAVPEPLRSSGHLACWYVMVDGQQHLGPYVSPGLALAAKRDVERQLH
jgi:hypothetical protein